MKNKPQPQRLFALAATALAALATVGALSGCAAVVVGGAVGTAMVVSDRRTAGTQLEDQNIELKALTRVREAVGDRGHINATSYNRVLLLSGEAQSDADRTAIEQSVARIEGVRSTVNELAVMGATSMTARSNDTILTSKVKASFIDAKDLQAGPIKVLTERGVVYLLGRVTEREANRATDLARGVSGVQKVVKLFEILSEAELANLGTESKK
jgi:osmotically-inducible protein OsmY